MLKAEALKGYCILHQLYLTDITSKLGQFHKRLEREREREKLACLVAIVENITNSCQCLCFQVSYIKPFTNW